MESISQVTEPGVSFRAPEKLSTLSVCGRLTVVQCDMRWSVLSVILASSLCTAGSHCPDPTQRQATINGQSFIAGSVYRDATGQKPLKFARVQVYSSLVQPGYTGETDKDGWFTTGPLLEGNYRLVVSGWGSTTVRLSPEQEHVELGGGHALILRDHECVLVGPLGGN